MENKIKIVFSDFDFTLVHRENEKDTFELVHRRFMSEKTFDYLNEISKKAKFILVSGRSCDVCSQTSRKLPVDSWILEYGGIIINNNETDNEYIQSLTDLIGNPPKSGGLLWDYNQKLKNSGFEVREHETRIASFKVDTDNLTIPRLEQLKNPPKGIEYAIEKGYYEYFVAPKAKAIIHLSRKTEISLKDSIGLGDGIPDLEMLSIVNFPITLLGAKDEVVRFVNQRRGYVSPYSSHKGTQDMLEHVLEAIG